MKFIGKLNLTKTELLDIVFGNESIALDKTILDQFFKPKPKQEVCELTIEKVKEIIQENYEKLGQNNKLVQKQKQFNSNQGYIKAFLLILILHLISKKGGVRLQLVEYLIEIMNSSSVNLESLNLATNPWQILEIFFEQSSVSEMIQKSENISGFVGLTEKEKEIIIRGIEKVYVLAIALQQVTVITQYLGLSIIAYSYYCENEHINSEFLSIFEKKASFSRNISFVAANITNLLYNSNLKKTSPSSDDINWVELCGQSKYHLSQLLNNIIEELQQDEDGLQIKGIDRTLQTVNQLSLALVGSLSCQMENSIVRINNTCSNQKNEKFKKFLEQSLTDLQQECDSNITSLSFRNKNKDFGYEVPYILNMAEYYNSLRKMIEVEAFMTFSLLDVKRRLLNPVLTPEQEEAERKKREEQEAKMTEKQKLKKKEAGEKKKKKIGFGVGTNLIFDLFVASINLEDIEDPKSNFQTFNQFFNINNQDLMQLFEELTVAKNSDRRGVKIAKGAQDFGGNEMALRRNIFNTVTQTFRDHGAIEIDTPVFELKETLTGKYGEDSKLIYDLEDQGGELLSLRYDLTVPFARFMAMQNKTQIKRYQVQKVYRRDQPNISRGRFREFYQCDLDICGKGDIMQQDCEIIKVFDSILKKLDFDNFVIKINNRKILDAMIQISGAPMNKFKAICSAVDKLDKEPWSNVQKELIEQKGIAVEAVNIIETFVNGKYTGKPEEVIQKLKEDKVFDGNQKGQEALQEMTVLFSYLKQLDCISNATFDLSLARGLDYYTGMIFEIVLTGELVGSIAGGGRYDELIGMFKDKKDALPAVGGSLGIERVYSILKAKNIMKKFTETQVLVCTIGNQTEEKLKICSELWNSGIKAEYLYKEKEKTVKQLEYAIFNNIPFVIWIGESEIEEGIVSIKSVYKKEEQKYKRTEYIDVLKGLIKQYDIDVEQGQVEYYVASQQQQQTEKKLPEKKQPQKKSEQKKIEE